MFTFTQLLQCLTAVFNVFLNGSQNTFAAPNGPQFVSTGGGNAPVTPGIGGTNAPTNPLTGTPITTGNVPGPLGSGIGIQPNGSGAANAAFFLGLIDVVTIGYTQANNPVKGAPTFGTWNAFIAALNGGLLTSPNMVVYTNPAASVAARTVTTAFTGTIRQTIDLRGGATIIYTPTVPTPLNWATTININASTTLTLGVNTLATTVTGVASTSGGTVTSTATGATFGNTGVTTLTGPVSGAGTLSITSGSTAAISAGTLSLSGGVTLAAASATSVATLVGLGAGSVVNAGVVNATFSVAGAIGTFVASSAITASSVSFVGGLAYNNASFTVAAAGLNFQVQVTSSPAATSFANFILVSSGGGNIVGNGGGGSAKFSNLTVTTSGTFSWANGNPLINPSNINGNFAYTGGVGSILNLLNTTITGSVTVVATQVNVTDNTFSGVSTFDSLGAGTGAFVAVGNILGANLTAGGVATFQNCNFSNNFGPTAVALITVSGVGVAVGNNTNAGSGLTAGTEVSAGNNPAY